MIRLLFLICVVLAFCFTAAAQETPTDFPHAEFHDLRKTGIAEVADVINPLTVQLANGETVHLVGLDFPDMDINEPGEFSLTAVKILKDMLIGETVHLYQTQNTNSGRLNRMGHHLTHLERMSDGAWIQGTILSLGLARAMTLQRNPEMAAEMYALESRAREDKTGLWATNHYKIMTPEETEGQIGKVGIVEGQIQSAAINKNRIYLNFGPDWRTDFTVTIAPENKRLFSKAGLDPLQWNNQTIRVRGLIQSYNGPYIEVTHPEAIEMIDSNP